jgi:hypothetical protein
MTRIAVLRPEFVDFIPEDLVLGVLYISMQYATAAHSCCCGCGREVVTPLSPTDWKLIFDGRSVSLEPSIGNWSFPCQSHYWIRHNHIRWAPHWSAAQIAAGRRYDAATKSRYFDSLEQERPEKEKQPSPAPETHAPQPTFWQKLRNWWS